MNRIKSLISDARRRFREFAYNISVSFQDRSFIVFSWLVLAALYAAIPLGLIMREPLYATFSTAVYPVSVARSFLSLISSVSLFPNDHYVRILPYGIPCINYLTIHG